MHEVQHVVALDDRIVYLRTPLNSTAIYPKRDHTLYNVLITKTNPYLYLCLDLHRVLFFSFFFSKLSTWSSSHVAISSFHVINITIWVPPCSSLGLHQPSSYHHSWQRLVLRFHQLSKTKLGLSLLNQRIPSFVGSNGWETPSVD